MTWENAYEEEVAGAWARLRKAWEARPLLAKVVRAIKETRTDVALRVSITVSTWGECGVNVHLRGVDDFAKVEPLRDWLAQNDHPSTGEHEDGEYRTYRHGRVTIFARPPKEDEDDTGAARCRAVPVKKEWVTAEPRLKTTYKIVCDDEMVAGDE